PGGGGARRGGTRVRRPAPAAAGARGPSRSAIARLHLLLVERGRAARLGLRLEPGARRRAARGASAATARRDRGTDREPALSDPDPAALRPPPGALRAGGAGDLTSLPPRALRHRQRLGRGGGSRGGAGPGGA